jgi:hypothetical protein
MKKLIYILFASVIILTGCSEDFELNDNDQDLNVQLLEGKYVAFSASGANTTIDPENVKEGETAELNVEIPTGTTSDVTVNFTFGGTAVYGTDFTVPGGSSAGGSVVIVPAPGEDTSNVIDNTDIVVTLLTDDTQDGNKTLEVILASASNAEGSINVGRGGTDLLKSQTVNISDVDCGAVAGLYDVTGTILVDDFGSGPYAYTDRIALSDCSVEGEYAISDITGGLYTNDYATAYNVTPAGAVIEFDPTADGPVTWSGVSDQFGGDVIEDPASATSSNFNATTGVITIYWTATAYGERGITVYTLPVAP